MDGKSCRLAIRYTLFSLRVSPRVTFFPLLCDWLLGGGDFWLFVIHFWSGFDGGGGDGILLLSVCLVIGVLLLFSRSLMSANRGRRNCRGRNSYNSQEHPMLVKYRRSPMRSHRASTCPGRSSPIRNVRWPRQSNYERGRSQEGRR